MKLVKTQTGKVNHRYYTSVRPRFTRGEWYFPPRKDVRHCNVTRKVLRWN